MLKKSYLCKVISVANFSWNKRKCLTSCEIAKSQQRIYKARSSSYTRAAYPCCIFRCLAIPTREYGGQPTFCNNKHCRITPIGCLRRTLVKFVIMSNTFLVLGLSAMGTTFVAISGCVLAKRKNRNMVLWTFICFCCGLLGLLPLACSETLEYDEELDYKESETLAYVMLVLALIWLGLTFYLGYSFVKSLPHL